MKKILTLMMIAIVLLTVFSGCTDNKDVMDTGSEDEEPSNNRWTEEGRCIHNGWYWNPEIVILDDGAYRMYVEDHGTDGASLIGIAVLSSRDGFNWTYDNLVMATASHPGIIHLRDGRWRLYYQCGESICSAISDDGLTFEKENGTRLDSDPTLEGANVRHPCVVETMDGGYRMYYDTEAETGGIRIWSAYSQDGLSFTREGVNIDLTPYRTDWSTGFYAHANKPEVLQTSDGTWRMFFASSPLIGSIYHPMVIRMATSTDGVNWDVKTTNCEIKAGKQPDGKYYGAFDVSVKEIDDKVRMWYCLFLSPAEGFVGSYSGIYVASIYLDELDK